MPSCRISLKGQKPLPKAYPRELETLGDHVRKKWLDLKLLLREVALILGVEEATIWNWENNYSSPKVRYIPRIVKFLGYVPFKIEAKTLRQKIVNYPRLIGMIQKELAKSPDVDPSTLARWGASNGQPQKELAERNQLNLLLNYSYG